MSKEHSPRPELPVTKADTRLPLEREYAFYFLQSRNGGRNGSEEQTRRLGEIRQRLRQLGKEAHKSDEQIEEWFAQIEQWALDKVANKTSDTEQAEAGAITDRFIIQPAHMPGPKAGSGTGFERAVIVEKKEQVETLIKRLGIPYRKFSEAAQTVAGSFRGVHYDEFLLLDRGKILFVCKQNSQRTFVLHGARFNPDSAEPPIVEVQKNDFKARNGDDVDCIVDYKNDPEAWNKMVEITISAPGEKAVFWKSARESCEEIGVIFENLTRLTDLACAQDPDLQNHFVTAIGVYKGEERVERQFTAVARERLKRFAVEYKKGPENTFSLASLTERVYEELGGQAVIGAPFEEVRQDLYWMLYRETSEKRGKADKGERIVVKKGGAIRTFVSKETGDRAVEKIVNKKKEHLKTPFKPEHFLADGVAQAVDLVMASGALPPDERRGFRNSLAEGLNNELRVYQKPYDPTTGQGNFGIFRNKTMESPIPMFTADLVRTFAEHYKQKIEKNRKLPKVESGDLSLHQVITQTKSKHPDWPFNVYDLWSQISKTFGIREADYNTNPRLTAGGVTLQWSSPHLYNYPTCFVPAGSIAGIQKMLEERCASELLVPYAEPTDVALANLCRQVDAILRAKGIVRSEHSLKKILQDECERIGASGIDISGCGKKRIKKDKFMHGIFFTQPVAEKIYENVVNDLTQGNG